MIDVVNEVKRLKPADNVEWTGDKVIANFDAATYAVNDTLEFPEKYEGDFIIRADKIESVRDGKKEVSYAPWVFVECTSTNGKKVAKRFYPSMLTKSRVEVDNDKLETDRGRVAATGTAVDAYLQYASVREALEAFRGKKMVITGVERIQCMKYNSDQTTKTNIYSVDLV